MKIELTKAQAKHLKYVLSEEVKELAECLNGSSLLYDKRYCRNAYNHSNNILTKLSEKEVA